MIYRVLVVDDHAPFRTAAGALLRAGGFEVVGEAGDADTALGLVPVLRPDVVLLDVRLPTQDGFAVAERLAAQRQPPRTVLVSSRPASEYGDAVSRAPVVGFLDKAELTAASLQRLLDTGDS
jgi:DNA-binding NarL/FixJ family response regulator